jgi:peptidyl-prolyl cis-trans isomerase B (cyclophilin B)
VKNFEYLGRKNFYNKLGFHRYVENYVIQGGDPDGTGKGGPKYTLPPETSELKHRRGVLGMARLGNILNPERRSNGSQFYICLKDSPHLDGFYTIFAEVIDGMETVDKLRIGDQIIRIRFPRRS